MSDWRSVLVHEGDSIREAISRIDASALQIALVTTPEGVLRGTITDGDVRRAILKGVDLNQPAKLVMNPNPTVGLKNESRSSIREKMLAKKINRIPIVDEGRNVVGLQTLEGLLAAQERPNAVVLMAGGMGKRLHPLTEHMPKPLLQVGDKPVLEIILNNCLDQGFRNFYFSVGFKAELIEEHFGDGSKWGANIRYLRETRPLGTAGALSLIPEPPRESLLVMNGDLLTKLNFGHLMDFHEEQKAVATMGIREYHFQVPFGVVKTENEMITGIDEKPMQKFFVNAGIYALSPDCLKRIPAGEPLDMPHLFHDLMNAKQKTAAFPIREYWIDIGRMDDLDKAKSEFDEVFKK